MTDMAADLGDTVTCPNCGAQVTVPTLADGVVACPKCGAAVHAVLAPGTSGDDDVLAAVGGPPAG